METGVPYGRFRPSKTQIGVASIAVLRVVRLVAFLVYAALTSEGAGDGLARMRSVA